MSEKLPPNEVTLGTVTGVKTATELGQRGGETFAVIQYQDQPHHGNPRTLDMWYPLHTPSEWEVQAGDQVKVTRVWNRMGKGRGTTSTLEKLVQPLK